MTITGESLTPSDAIAFTFSDGQDAFYSSLSNLKSLLQPKTPAYFILRRSTDPKDGLTYLTYIPHDSPVRSKTLFASTRATLRDFEGGKLSSQYLAAEETEVYSEDAWHDRFNDKPDEDDQELTATEKELNALSQAQNEVSFKRQDIGIGGSIGQDTAGEQKPLFSIGEGVEDALKGLNEEGFLVKLVSRPPSHHCYLHWPVYHLYGLF